MENIRVIMTLLAEIDKANITVNDYTKIMIENWLVKNNINREKEIRFVIPTLPNIPLLKTILIEQAYGDEGRIRSEQSCGIRTFTKAIKTGTKWGNFELEAPIDREIFDKLWMDPKVPKIKKIRHIMQADDTTWEIDLFDDIIIAECEWTDKMPDTKWILEMGGKDITEDKSLSNWAMAKRGVVN